MVALSWVKTSNVPVAIQSLDLFCNRANVSFPTVYMLEETVAMFVLKVESGITTNVFQSLKSIPQFVSPALQAISSTQKANAKERKKDVPNTDKMSAHHVRQITSLMLHQEDAFEDHPVVYTTTGPNAFHAKANTFTIKPNKDVSSLVVLSTLKTADVLNALCSSS